MKTITPLPASVTPTDQILADKYATLLNKYHNLEQDCTQLVALRALNDCTQLGVFSIINGAFTYHNKAAALHLQGISPQFSQAGDENLATNQSLFETDLQTVLYKVPAFHREFRVRHKNQSKLYAFFYERIVQDRTPGVMGTIYDVTLWKPLQNNAVIDPEQWLRTQKMENLHSLTRGAAHDFSNILSSILGNLALFRTESPQARQKLDLVNQMENSVRRAMHLVSELLVYSQPEKMDRKGANLNTLIKQAVEILKSHISKKIMLHYQLLPDLPLIEVDLQQIQEIIHNLCLNAAHAIGDTNGIITLTTGNIEITENFCRQFEGYLTPRPGAYVVFETHDTGPTLDPTTLQARFQDLNTPNLQIGDPHLPIVLNLIEKNNGFLEARSQAGSGTSVMVYLPVSKKHFLTDDKIPKLLENVETILLADDEEIVQLTIKRILCKLGYNVYTADNGQQAVELFQKMKDEIDLILLDLTMPVMSGNEALLEIQKIKADAKVILFSGYDEIEAARRLPIPDMAGFIEKPSLFEELSNRITDLFRRKE